MEKQSLWMTELKNIYLKLTSDLEVDVLIIGGGITGLSAAYYLKDSNLKVALVEKNMIGSGVTSKSTAKITYLQNLIYSKIEEEYNFDVAKKYYESQKEAIDLIEKIISKNKIECDYSIQKSYLFASSKDEVKKIKHEKKLLEKMDVYVKEIKKIPLNIHSYYGIRVDDTACFHPVKYLNALAKICSNDIEIYENTCIYDFKENDDKLICFTQENKIITKKIVFACHYPFFTIPYLFPLKGYLERSYISACKVSKNKNVSGINTSNNTISFRYHIEDDVNYLIYLRTSHNLANKFNVKENFKSLYNDLDILKLKPEYFWTNEDIITNDNLPYIGEFKNNLYIGIGYNTWGMTNGTIAGKVISDIILNKENQFISLFNPLRNTSVFKTIHNIYSSAKPFLENKIIKNKEFYNKNVIFTKRNGKSVGIYIDKDGKEHIVYNLCPHLKCSLIFNEEELTWDCPCHSSRFDLDGNVIKGPSNYNITYKN